MNPLLPPTPLAPGQQTVVMRSVSALTLDEAEFAAAAPPEETLKSVADQACKKVLIGTALMPDPLWNEASYATTVRQEFNSIIVEHHLKWEPLLHGSDMPDVVQTLGRYDFTTVDRLVDWAVAHDLHVKGHVLIWHVTSPTTLLSAACETPDQLRQAMQRHIHTTMAHFRGRISDWDVVNEALAPDGTLAENLFCQSLGPGYIADCFRWAAAADPSARLFYNDNKVEGIGTPKAEAFYNLVADLKAQGVPLHGVGLQGHWKAGGVGRQAVPTPRQVKQQIRRLGKLGLVVHLSEVDVRVGTLEPAKRHAAQSQIYHDLLAAALSEQACEGIYVWGFTDKHTWVTQFYQDVNDDDEAPLLWDKLYRRKPAYYAVRQALQSLTAQGRVGGEGVLLEGDVDIEGRTWGHAWRPTIGPDAGSAHVAGDDRPDWLQQDAVPTVETNPKPDWLQDGNTPTPPASNPKAQPDALFNLREDEAEVDIVQQNHRTMSSMFIPHVGDMEDGEAEGNTGDDDDEDDDDEGAAESGDDLSRPLENVRDDIPELS